jgi:hypothetical protein
MNRAAQALGRRAAGVPKNYSAAEIELRKKRLAEAGKLRWKGHVKKAKKNVASHLSGYADYWC